MPSLTLGYTDEDGIARTNVLLATNTGNTTATKVNQWDLIRTNTSTAVTITSAGYASNTANTMTYRLICTVEQLS
jgi:hypothetical protein